MQDWKRTRVLAFFGAIPYANNKLKSPDDLFLLDEELPEKPGEMSAERMRELFARWDEKVKQENAK